MSAAPVPASQARAATTPAPAWVEPSIARAPIALTGVERLTAVARDGDVPFIARSPIPPAETTNERAQMIAPPALAPVRARRRWSASIWLLARGGEGGGALAPGGTLGGSQAGGRLLYRLNEDARRPLALAGRVYAPLRRTSGAEAAIGLDWQPLPAPVHALVERRVAIGRDGRSAFALTIYGGRSVALPRRFRLDAYAQAGLVGARRRDAFADGAARLIAPLGPVELGAGLWGAAQPGVARLDAGPATSVRVPLRNINLRLYADWRFRLAGDAAPGSGPALTLASDF